MLFVAMEVGVLKQVVDASSELHIAVQERGDVLGKAYNLGQVNFTLKLTRHVNLHHKPMVYFLLSYYFLTLSNLL
jgi:hypothetical protein